MKRYTILSDGNILQVSGGYTKVGTFPFTPEEMSNYTFPLDAENMVMDVYWVSAGGNQAQWAKFGFALYNSTTLKCYLMSATQSSRLVENPIAWKKTDSGIDLYVRVNSSIYSYQSVKCDVVSINERFIPLSGNIIEDITDLDPVYFNPTDKLLNIDGSTVELCNIHKLMNSYFYNGNTSSATITIPSYTNPGRYLIRITNAKASTYKAIDITVYNGTMTVKYPHSDDSAITATFNDTTGVISLSGVSSYSHIYYEIAQF